MARVPGMIYRTCQGHVRLLNMSTRAATVPGSSRLAVSVCGSGEPVLFLHGIGGNRSNWDEQVERFGASGLALALDFRGYGDSEDPGEPFDFFMFVEEVRRTLDHFGLPRADLVGLSMGGLVAQGFYARYPARVRSLCLAACRPGSAPVAPGEGGASFLADRQGPILAGGAEALAASLAPKLIGSAAPPSARAAIRASLEGLRPESYLRALAARVALQPFLELSSVTVPTLVVAGEDDQVAPVAQMEALAGAITGSRLVVLPRAGHLLNLEQPELFDTALTEFLNDARARELRNPAAAA